MPELFIRQLLMWVALVIAAVAAIAGVVADAEVAMGAVAGGGWNLASLWCLAQLLNAWLGPRASRRLATLWAIVKFPALYLLAFALFQIPGLSPMGFAIGFTAILIAAIGGLMVFSQRLAAPPSKVHGR